MKKHTRRKNQSSANSCRNWSAGSLAVAIGVALAAPAEARDGIYTLVSVSNGECLQPVNGSLNQGDAIVQEPCDGSSAQQWTTSDDDCTNCTYFHLVNGASHLCLDARGTGAPGTPIQQWTCNGISNENWNSWSPTATGERLNSGITHAGGACIVAPGTQPGLAVALEYCPLKSQQPSLLWKFSTVASLWKYSVVYKDNSGNQVGVTKTVTARSLAEALLVVSNLPAPPPGATQQDVTEQP